MSDTHPSILTTDMPCPECGRTLTIGIGAKQTGQLFDEHGQVRGVTVTPYISDDSDLTAHMLAEHGQPDAHVILPTTQTAGGPDRQTGGVPR